MGRLSKSLYLTIFMPVAVVLLLSAFFLYEAHEISNREHVIQAMGNLLEFRTRILKTIGDMDAGQQSYLITGNPTFLRDFSTNEKLVLNWMNEFPTYSVQMSQHIIHAKIEFAKWVAQARNVQRLRKTGGKYNQSSFSLANRKSRDSISRDFLIVRDLQIADLKRQHADADEGIARLFIWGSVLSLMLSLGLAFMLKRRLSILYNQTVNESRRADLASRHLTQSQERLTFALESARMGTFEVDIKNQTAKCSEQMLELFGIAARDFDGQRTTLQAKVHPLDREVMKSAIDYAVENNSIYDCEYRIYPQVGVERWIHSRGRCALDPVTKAPLIFTGVVYDITDRKIREAKNDFLLKSVAAFSGALTSTEVLETSVQLCANTFGSKSGFLAVANDDHSKLVLIPRSQPIPVMSVEIERDGIPIESGFATAIAFRTGVPQFVSSRVERDRIYKYDVDHVQSVWVDGFACLPIRLGNRIYAVLAIAFEEPVVWSEPNRRAFIAMGELIGQALERSQLYQQKEIERVELKQTARALEQAVISRDQFLSIASHELRTPLTSLQLQIQLRQRELKRSFDTEFSKEKIERNLGEQYGYVRRIARLVDDILDVSRIAEGKLHMQFVDFDLCEMVTDVLRQFQVTADTAQVEVRFEQCAAIHGQWDRFRLEQVLLNLLTNAIRYGNKKPIHVSLSTGDGRACLKVRDEGMGIKPEDQARVFDRFERAISEYEVSGLGLGLYVSREIVRAHGGEIVLNSEVGKGSEFSVYLPLGQ